MIGQSHARLGGDRLVAGAGRFVADIRLPGMLEAAVLRSLDAHARIVATDTKRARELPGVHAVLTAADVPPVDGFYQGVPATTNPLGLRGLGECGNPGLGGAIANAVCDALRDRGVTITSLPLTPDRVLTAIQRAVNPAHARSSASFAGAAGVAPRVDGEVWKGLPLPPPTS